MNKIELLYRSFKTASSDAPAKELSYFEVIEIFCSMVKILYQNLPSPHPVTLKEAYELTSLKNMITYVEEHLAERLTLDDIALAGACCKSRCSYIFKKYLRDTPISYITKLRLRKSLVSLLKTDSGVTDIAYECGFGGASYYCEIFRKYYGISPLQYKKEQLALNAH
ncbi:MAG: AraC family transcriptional regulator [Lachnospiraceae bacterium]|nr:AraC family transcriptional regulator [Lachnospiraceae bacterium]